ncbi:DUF1893 domain-containing protein [Bifidobacterium callitrichidarum]|uniref:DUF1893 domain-containing protein n=1 Tax=Bifidobacterium callitrichidarum TaxID=2052941 RepID=A0A2U2N4M7_9BIFI|nr:DUF1893 domain-containing protein [Bifidobacterium callitrichidarum]PWG63998.1 hypothetical protein DF196_09750 [Bifidobacterium callitrichidarum]
MNDNALERAKAALLADPSVGCVACRVHAGGDPDDDMGRDDLVGSGLRRSGGDTGYRRNLSAGTHAESDEILTGFGHGVRPLLQWLAAGQSLIGYCAADRVVGKGAALLYARLGVRAVYAETMSEAGLAALRANGIAASYGTLVPVILNRSHTGVCPIEQSVASIGDPAAAEPAIRAAVARLMRR